MNLTSVENVKGYLGINSASDDALLDRLVSAGSGYIQSWLNRSFAIATYTDTFDGNGSVARMLSSYPITSMTSVLVNNIAIPLAADALSVGYSFSPTRVILRGYNFSKGLLNCSVTYKAGYANVPLEIEQACIEIIANRYREKDRIGQVSKSLAGEVVSFSQKDMPDSVRTILSNYKKVIPI